MNPLDSDDPCVAMRVDLYSAGSTIAVEIETPVMNADLFETSSIATMAVSICTPPVTPILLTIDGVQIYDENGAPLYILLDS